MCHAGPRKKRALIGALEQQCKKGRLMKHHRMMFHGFLRVIRHLSIIPVVALGQQGVMHPYWAPRTWQLGRTLVEFEEK